MFGYQKTQQNKTSEILHYISWSLMFGNMNIVKALWFIVIR